jgi:hypothetical protein
MKSVAIIVLVMSAIFFSAGWYELTKAKETAGWPSYPAKITAARVEKVEDSGSYVKIEGAWLDSGVPFTVKRYAYAVVNGLSPRQPYLAPYKAGLVTNVYMDPHDRDNVILNNHPSLSGMHLWQVTTAVAFVASLLYLVFRRKTSDRHSDDVPRTRTIVLPEWGSILVGALMGLLCLALGAWIIHMGMIGHSPAETWSPGESKVVLCMGLLFAYGGVQTLILSIGGARIPKVVHKIMLSLFLIILALPFIAAPIFDPGGITSSSSINGLVIHEQKGSVVGAVVFMMAGVLCVVGALWSWRWWKK